MLILVPKNTPRLAYTLDFILVEILNISYQTTTSIDFFKSSENKHKWSYGVFCDENTPTLPSFPLMFEETIVEQTLEKIEKDTIIALFKTEEIYNEIHFDVIASVFYLISRYEEYLPAVHDPHGRYASFQSVASQYDFLDIPMVNRYIDWLARWLTSQFKTLDIKPPKGRALFTFDIDHPFYSQGISIQKKITRQLRDLFSNTERDKFDTFDFIHSAIDTLDARYFVLCPKEPSKNDHFVLREDTVFTDLIRSLSQKINMGIHPSYFSIDYKLISSEIQWLESKIGNDVFTSRFHYLRFKIEQLIAAYKNTRIKDDFSMAYGNISGFRSSTSFPYYFFDLQKNRKTELKIWTPCIMDSTYEYYRGNDKKELFLAKTKQYIREIKQYGGTFTPIFHNDILSHSSWKETLIETVKIVRDEL